MFTDPGTLELGESLLSLESNCLRQRVREHLAKIRAERERSFPNEGLIRYWEREIRAFEQGIARAQRRSERKR